jgi:hypothetical protein
VLTLGPVPLEETNPACYVNTLRTGDAILPFFASLHYNFERRMTQICVLTRAWFLRTYHTTDGAKKIGPSGPDFF